MNPFEVEELLQKARKRRLDESPGVVLKPFTALSDFEFHGHKFVADADYELSDGECRELYGTGKIQLHRGVGQCDTSLVKRVGREPLYAYRSWRFEPSAPGPKGPFDDAMLKVRINKPSQVIIGLFLQPGEEFFMPYRELCQFEFDLETDRNQHWLKTLTVLADQE